jgi:uncharacterized membrane protein
MTEGVPQESVTFRLERELGRLLLAGVAIAAVLLAVGLALWFAGTSARADLLLRAGLVALMATPIVRVVLSLAAFVRARDWFFVVMTLSVLAVLGVTLAVALSKT